MSLRSIKLEQIEMVQEKYQHVEGAEIHVLGKATRKYKLICKQYIKHCFVIEQWAVKIPAQETMGYEQTSMLHA